MKGFQHLPCPALDVDKTGSHHLPKEELTRSTITETPRPYGRGLSEVKLRLSGIFFALIADVISHCFLAHADR